MAGMTELQQMLATMEPRVRDGELVHVADPEGSAAVLEPEALIHEDDHLLVPVAQREDAVRVLRELSSQQG